MDVKKLIEYMESSFLRELVLLESVTDISYNGESIYYIDNRFGRLKWSTEVEPQLVKDFIRQTDSIFSKEELMFLKNPNSHADFLIYKKVSHRPILVIEVDGVSFHEQRKEQQARDLKKNSILEKSGITLLRLKTNESDEERRIRDSLDSLLYNS